MDWIVEVKAAVSELRISGDSLADNLSRITQEQDPKRILQQTLHAKCLDIFEFDPTSDVLQLIPLEMAMAFCVMPLERIGERLKLAVLDPCDLNACQSAQVVSGLDVDCITSDRGAIEEMIQRYYRPGQASSAKTNFQSIPQGKTSSTKGLHKSNEKGANQRLILSPGASHSPIIRLVHEVLSEAIHRSASDIHFESYEREMVIRFRVDGILQPHRTVNAQSKAEVVSRLKVMANLDIAEKRRPQDGRIRVEGSGRMVDLRVSTLPTEFGEKVVLRILDKTAVALDMEKLGLDRQHLDLLNHAIRRPHGMILVTGPTGSGKTTTLYSALNRIKTPGINITTVEDPIEYKVDGIVQTAVKADIGYTFAGALRTILRQDPNVIMVGEIRDRETADIAIRSALTGHLVLSTLHTNDAPSAVTRLLDMGVEPFLVSSSIHLIAAQRLVRCVCSRCSEEMLPSKALCAELNLPEGEGGYRQGRGCLHCGQSGYQGRLGLFEVMPLTDEIRTAIVNKADASVLRDLARKQGMLTLREDGLRKAKLGLTTLDEVVRECV